MLALPALYKVAFFSFYELNRDYIAQTYCVNRERPITMCYGRCFLQRGIALADQTTSNQTLSAQVRSMQVEFLTTIVALAPPAQVQPTMMHPPAPVFPFRSPALSSVFHPPAV